MTEKTKRWNFTTRTEPDGTETLLIVGNDLPRMLTYENLPPGAADLVLAGIAKHIQDQLDALGFEDDDD